jgi:hypothetical protein
MRFAAMIALLGLAACQTPCPATEETTTATFHCEDGSDLHVTFAGHDAVVEQEGYVTLSLHASVMGGGYRYANNGAELRGRGTQTEWTRPGAAETTCRQTQ